MKVALYGVNDEDRAAHIAALYKNAQNYNIQNVMVGFGCLETNYSPTYSYSHMATNGTDKKAALFFAAAVIADLKGVSAHSVALELPYTNIKDLTWIDINTREAENILYLAKNDAQEVIERAYLLVGQDEELEEEEVEYLQEDLVEYPPITQYRSLKDLVDQYKI